MSNARVTIANLLRDLESTFNDRRIPDTDRKLFFEQLYGALDAATSISSLLFGHSTSTLIQSIRSALITVSTVSHDPRVRGLWNPVTAILLKNLEDLVRLSEVDDLSSRVSTTSLTAPVPLDRVKTDSHASPKKKATSKPLALTKQQVNVVDSPAPILQDRDAITIRAETKGPWFPNLSHVKCSAAECSFCEQLWHALHLTRCVDIKCHKKGVKCNTLGWSAHVFPTMWLAAKIDHDAGRPFPGLAAYARPNKDTATSATVADKVDGRASPTFAEVVSSQRKRILDVDMEPKSPLSPKQSRLESDTLIDDDDDLSSSDWNNPSFEG